MGSGFGYGLLDEAEEGCAERCVNVGRPHFDNHLGGKRVDTFPMSPMGYKTTYGRHGSASPAHCRFRSYQRQVSLGRRRPLGCPDILPRSRTGISAPAAHGAACTRCRIRCWSAPASRHQAVTASHGRYAGLSWSRAGRRCVFIEEIGQGVCYAITRGSPRKAVRVRTTTH